MDDDAPREGKDVVQVQHTMYCLYYVVIIFYRTSTAHVHVCMYLHVCIILPIHVYASTITLWCLNVLTAMLLVNVIVYIISVNKLELIFLYLKLNSS